MAFVSEIHYRNNVARKSGFSEYVEVTVSPDDMGRLADFMIATYDHNGNVVTQTSLLDLTGVLDPETGWYVFTFETVLSGNGNGSTDTEPSAVAFVDLAASPTVQSFVDIGSGPTGITAQDGPAAGFTSANIAATQKDSIQWDAYGNRIDGDLSPGTSSICLTKGTLIATPKGEVPIESLVVGDLVRTHDNGDQPIRMIHKSRLEGDVLRRNRKLWPVCIQQGALGFGLPRRRLWVSPQHRMLFANIRVPLMFGEDAVLVRAKSLAASFEEVYVDNSLDEVTYFHLVFDRHEIIYAEGAATESFQPGPEGIAALDSEAKSELFALFPHLRMDSKSHEAAYLTLRSWELMAAVG